MVVSEIRYKKLKQLFNSWVPVVQLIFISPCILVLKKATQFASGKCLKSPLSTQKQD